MFSEHGLSTCETEVDMGYFSRFIYSHIQTCLDAKFYFYFLACLFYCLLLITPKVMYVVLIFCWCFIKNNNRLIIKYYIKKKLENNISAKIRITSSSKGKNEVYLLYCRETKEAAAGREDFRWLQIQLSTALIPLQYIYNLHKNSQIGDELRRKQGAIMRHG